MLHPSRRSFPCFLPLGLVWGCCLAAAAQAGETATTLDRRIDLEPLVVVASKIQRPLSEVAAQVTVIDAEDVSRGLVEDIDGLLRYEPGLEMESAGTRFGGRSISIRGMGGNRVAVEQDGIPVRDGFAVGAFSDSGRALVETDRIKRVEVLHGPASALYGSNALGGVVAITTWDPSDLLMRRAGNRWFSLKAGYQGANDSWVGSGVGVAGNERHGLLVAATYRQGHQLDHQAPAGTPDDPQDWDSRDVMLRYTFDTAAGHRLRLTATGQERDVETQINSQLGFGRRFSTTTALEGIDHDENQRYALDYEFSMGGWEQGRIQVYRTEYVTKQLTLETRGNASPPVALQRDFSYEQQHTGVELNLFRQERWGNSLHRLGLGVEWLQTDTEDFRDGLQTNLNTGAATHVILGEAFPVRDFPRSRGRELGVFVQDEISPGTGRWSLIPALRWDSNQLDPAPDALWLQSFPDTEVVSVSESKFTPRLGVLFQASEHWGVYAQYARGFRAPPFEDVNIGLNIPLFGYRAIANPELKSETSTGLELGLRWLTEGTHFSLALFHTDYDQFIETRANIGIDPATGDLLFQSRNIDQARIYGVDVRLEQDLGQLSDALQGWSINLAGYWSEGENRGSRQPLNSIAPPQAVAGLRRVSASGDWDVGATVTWTAAKSADDIDPSDGARYATAGWGVVDLSAGWRYSDRLELRGGIFNLGDKTYQRWLDVARLDANDPMIPLLSRPGRSYSVTARLVF